MERKWQNFRRLNYEIELLINKELLDSAEEKLLKKIGNSPSAELYNLLGLVYHKQSRFPEALKAFEQALKICPFYLESSLNLAATLCDLGCYNQAQEIFKQIEANPSNNALKHNPSLSQRLESCHINTGFMYYELEQFYEASQEFRKALDLQQQHPDIMIIFVDSLKKLNKLDLAKIQLEELTALYPNYSQAYLHLGLLEWELGNFHAAKENWKKAIKCSPKSSIAQAYLNNCTLHTPRKLNQASDLL